MADDSHPTVPSGEDGQKFSVSEAFAENKLKHRKAPNYSTHHASGAIISGPAPDGSLHLIFYAEAVDVLAETFQVQGDVPEDIVVPAGYNVVMKRLDSRSERPEDPGVVEILTRLTLEPEDVEPFREDLTRVSMDIRTARALHRLLGRHLPPEEVSEDSESESEK